ncbi:MAG: BspA family leucine-rich repeat surface protein [Algicola sp.]|nr:BspA family leucine-rich repeat surface protein [Algicola sp.]
MKRIYKLFMVAACIVATMYSCDVDSTDYALDTRDVYIESIVIEASKNSCIEEDIQVSVSNPTRSITASLPSECDASEIVLTINVNDGITTSPGSGSSFSTGASSLLVSGFDLEEEYTINLKVLQPFESDVEFVSVWRVNANESITLPLVDNGNYNFKVFWGDGQESIVATYDLESATHTYTQAGDYTVTVWGVIEGFNFYKTDQSAGNILDITNWGQVKLGNDEAYFRNCSNLQISAADSPDLTGTTTLKAMFRGATSFNSDINHWDVSGVENMQDLFFQATNYNQPLDQWNVGNVTTFETMFRQSAFDQDISGWDVSKASTLKNMFRDSPFDKPIGNWDISNVTSLQSTFRGNNAFSQDLSGWGDKLGSVVTMRELFRDSDYNGDLSAWDVSKVVSMWDMFKDSGFNNPSITGWNVSGLDNMETMFGGAGCAFNQDISGWNVSNVVNMQNLFKENQVFNQDLSGWDVGNVMCNLDFDTDAPQWEAVHKPNFVADKTDNNEYCSREY